MTRHGQYSVIHHFFCHIQHWVNLNAYSLNFINLQCIDVGIKMAIYPGYTIYNEQPWWQYFSTELYKGIMGIYISNLLNFYDVSLTYLRLQYLYYWLYSNVDQYFPMKDKKGQRKSIPQLFHFWSQNKLISQLLYTQYDGNIYGQVMRCLGHKTSFIHYFDP